MLEVEGGTDAWCMKILRHEAGHAIDNAYRLQRRRKRQKLFGRNSVPYPEYYTPKPYSKSFVLHLDTWYAQSHPAEDFAETFAVWLTPDSRVARALPDWPALKKLEYMDELMRDIAGRPPLVTARQQFEPLPHLRRTLRAHYSGKREHYGVMRPNFYDRDLRRLFSDAPEAAGNPTAARVPDADPQATCGGASPRGAGIHQYTVDQVFEDIIARCRQLKLRLARPEEQTRLDFTVLLTVQTMNYLHSGRHRVAAVKKLRVLALMHAQPRAARRRDGLRRHRRSTWKMEFDVAETLRSMGHEVHPAAASRTTSASSARRSPSRKPHIVFNLLESFHGDRRVRQHVVELPRAAAASRTPAATRAA